jgi:mono/diheme cytochrome c family protein
MKIGNILAIILMSIGLASAAQASGDGSAGEKIVTGVCAACHGIDGNSVITTNPEACSATS